MTAKHAKKFSKATYKPFAPLGLYYIAVFAAIHHRAAGALACTDAVTLSRTRVFKKSEGSSCDLALEYLRWSARAKNCKCLLSI